MPLPRIVFPSMRWGATGPPLAWIGDGVAGDPNLWLDHCTDAMILGRLCLKRCVNEISAGGGMREPFKNLAWDDFRLVKAIADAKGLPAAAEHLGVNHSTVFRRLRQIEEALGSALFERHRQGYVATSAGEEMVALADRLDE